MLLSSRLSDDVRDLYCNNACAEPWMRLLTVIKYKIARLQRKFTPIFPPLHQTAINRSLRNCIHDLKTQVGKWLIRWSLTRFRYVKKPEVLQLLLDVDLIRCKGFWLENQSAYRDAKAELGGIPSPLACSASVLLERGSVPKFDSGLRKASKFYFHKSSFDRRSPPLIQMFSSPYPSAAVKIIAAFLWELATRRKPVAISFPWIYLVRFHFRTKVDGLSNFNPSAKIG